MAMIIIVPPQFFVCRTDGNVSNGFQIFACLPEEGDDPIENCQVASYIHLDDENRKDVKSKTIENVKQMDDNLRILAHDIKFGPSMACSDETPHMRGYLDSHQNILCTLGTEQCNRLIRGPVFCQNHDQVPTIVIDEKLLYFSH